MSTYFVVILCVVGIAVGQILFKVTSSALKTTGSIFAFETLLPLVSAMCLYGITSLVWVWVLQKVELGKVYPFMALAFVIVPVGSHFVFGERFTPQYFLGVAFIMAGIVFAVKA